MSLLHVLFITDQYQNKYWAHKNNVRFVCRMAHVLFTLCVLVCVEWCPTPIFVVFIDKSGTSLGSDKGKKAST
jgi:hypothetical protein